MHRIGRRTAELAISRSNPLALICPTRGTLATISLSAIPANAPHPMTLPDVPGPEGTPPVAEVTLLAPSLEEQEKLVPEARDAWRDTFGIWGSQGKERR